MKKLLALGVAAAVAAAFVVFTKDEPAPVPIESAPELTSPLVTVVEGEATLTKNGETRTLGEPEEVDTPFILVTKAGASVIVSFPDGSELRLDENSEMLVSDATYAPDDGELVVHTKLTIGKVWSSIVALVTPESSWEVETSNVVATVRGTAFGVEASADKTTTVTGSEHTIELTLKDPDTGERDPNRKIGLNEDEVVVIGDEDARDKTKEFPASRKRTNADAENPWVKKNEGRGDPGKLLDDDSLEGALDDAPVSTPGTPAVSVPRTGTPTPARPLSVTILPSQALNGITEGTPVTMTATLNLSDGTKRDISREATWRVVGSVGNIQGNTFTPLLDASVSEFGRAYGSINANWKDSATGASLEASSEIFEVKPKIIQGIEEG